MHIAGIIAEYNPFHRGHAKLLEKVRLAGASHIVCVISGDFVQRGEPAIMDKWARARAAVACGADLVLELPLSWALSPARRFANGGVYILDALGCVDMLCFGSECGSLDLLLAASQALALEQTQGLIRAELDSGSSYAAAAQAALRSHSAPLADLLSTANNTLALEYLDSLARLNSPIRPFTIPREEGEGCRAEELRRGLRSGGDIAPLLPPAGAQVLREEAAAGRVLCGLSQAERLIFSRLCSMRKEELAALPEVREGLENRLFRAAQDSNSLGELLEKAKSRRFTLASLRRLALDALLGVRAEDWLQWPPYIHVLAMGGGAHDILRAARKTTRLPIIQRAGQLHSLGADARECFALERRSERLWRQLLLPNK
ncbi:MAG: nucleotidyltransferase family protein [Clostridium sp.]|jgi:predicted nucleotidyltransferase|nr:nucleotidyltransferase family protein [Clostridium sp.]